MCKKEVVTIICLSYCLLGFMNIITHNTIKDSAFRKYDIRGKVGDEISINATYDLARTVAYFLLKKDPQVKTVAVGMDGRTHSPAIKEQVCKALSDSGLDVVFVGLCTSPVLYFSLFKAPVDAGIMITASHNAKEYNGMKICVKKDNVYGEEIQEIKNLLRAKKRIVSKRRGTYQRVDGVELYINYMKDHFKQLVGSDISAVIDCGNGAAGAVLPRLIEKMEWKNVSLLFADVDGTYPNHEANPIVEENMKEVKKALQESDIALGAGLDGDGDRMAAMIPAGDLLIGDRLLAIYAKYFLPQNPGASVVFDVTVSSGLLDVIKKYGGEPVFSPSGVSFIKANMRKSNALLGGEMSCHLFFKDDYFWL